MAIGTTRGKRRLGRFVAPIIKRSELNAEQIAKLVGCSKNAVYRLLSGDSLPRRHLFTAIMATVGATEAEREQGLQLWHIADADTTVIQHAQDLPVKYMRFRLDESEATRERTFDSVIVPGMLQTADYALALAHGSRRLTNGDSWEERIAAERRDRQNLLHRVDEPLHLHALLDEAVLRRKIGGAEVMANQLDHLLKMGELSNITIQVVPLDAGAHGLMSGEVTLLSFGPGEAESAYLEHVAGLETVENVDAVVALSESWSEVAALALSPHRSAVIIEEVLEGP